MWPKEFLDVQFISSFNESLGFVVESWILIAVRTLPLYSLVQQTKFMSESNERYQTCDVWKQLGITTFKDLYP